LLYKGVKCVVKFFGHAAEPDKGLYYLLLGYCNSDLEKILKVRKLIPENEAVKIMEKIFQAQNELSEQKIIHRDSKP
jgi:serine/threonine protein kinase